MNSSSSRYSITLITMWWPSIVVVQLLRISNLVVASQSIINTLPGLTGELPFKLETGYIGVGELDEVQLFYYFIESERSPKDDPLVLRLSGGLAVPVSRAFYLKLVANIIFLDAPVGTGFSYATTWEAYLNVSDTSSAAQTYEFLRKWLLAHSMFLSNPLYIGGDSYSGIPVPIIVQEVSNGNEIGHLSPLNLRGFVLGNPLTHKIFDLDARLKFAHRMTLISNKLYESTKRNCKGEYIYPDPSNAKCIEDLQVVEECISQIFLGQILEPNCEADSPKPNKLREWSVLDDNFIDIHTSTPQILGRSWCRLYNYRYSYVWANDKTVREALHIREGTKTNWERCNTSLAYTENVITSIDYHRNLTKKDLRALVYSGDHDMMIPYVGTEEWIETLDLSIKDDWRPWFVDGQIAGYVTTFTEEKYSLTCTTIKGGGHTAPEYKPKECLAMIDRWFSYYFL